MDRWPGWLCVPDSVKGEGRQVHGSVVSSASEKPASVVLGHWAPARH